MSKKTKKQKKKIQLRRLNIKLAYHIEIKRHREGVSPNVLKTHFL